MSHYSEDDNSVRVDFFKPSGKWYTTEAVKWTGPYQYTPENGSLIHDSFKKSLLDHFRKDGDGRLRLRGMQAVCLEPYRADSHPISLIIGEDWTLEGTNNG